MRISIDKDSWKAGGILRRDFRHSHDGPEVTGPPRTKKKDTKTWCKGKVGRPHVPEYISIEGAYYTHTIHRCANCHRELSYSYGHGRNYWRATPDGFPRLCQSGEHHFRYFEEYEQAINATFGIHICKNCGLVKGQRRQIWPLPK